MGGSGIESALSCVRMLLRAPTAISDISPGNAPPTTEPTRTSSARSSAGFPLTHAMSLPVPSRLLAGGLSLSTVPPTRRPPRNGVCRSETQDLAKDYDAHPETRPGTCLDDPSLDVVPKSMFALGLSDLGESLIPEAADLYLSRQFPREAICQGDCAAPRPSNDTRVFSALL